MKTKTEKRKPLLIDEVLASRYFPPDKAGGDKFISLRNRLADAKVFVLDKAAAVYAAEMISKYPTAIAHDQEFAIPMFPRMYIELSYPSFYETVNGKPHDNTYGDTEVGYFIDGPRAYVMSRASKGWNVNEEPPERRAMLNKPMVLPTMYKLNQPFTPDEEGRACDLMQVSRVGLDAFFWGSSAEKVSRDEQALRALRANHSFEFWYGSDVEGAAPLMYKMAAGDLRNILALTLFLNRTREISYEEQLGPHRGFVGPKPRVYLKHSIVRLRLDPKPMLRKLYGTGGAWRREHDVRGHFCHDKVARDHKHHLSITGLVPTPSEGHAPDWREYDVNQWRCMVCGGKRWHRNPHKRGHKEKGKVETSYEVTK